MAIAIINDADIFLGTAEYSCVANNVAMEMTAEELDATTFCSGGFKTPTPGLKSFTANISGYWDGPAEAVGTAALGSSQLLTVAPTGDSTAPYFFGLVQEGSVSVGGGVGELLGLTINASGSGASGVLSGFNLAPSAARNGSGTLTGVDYGSSPLSTTNIYAGIHVLSGSGTPADTIKIYSSSTNVFTSETERFSWSGGTAMSDLPAALTGITHRYWRVKYVVSAPTTFVVSLAIR